MPMVATKKPYLLHIFVYQAKIFSQHAIHESNAIFKPVN